MRNSLLLILEWKRNQGDIMRFWHYLLAALGLFCLQPSAAEIIRVGGYAFSPFVTKQQTHYQGFSIQLLDALNQLQDRYHFQFTPTTPGSRHLGFQHRRFDMIFFEDPAWGWQSQAIDFIPFHLEDGDVMVALARSGRSNDFFDNLEDKSLIAVENYHYGFANMNSQANELKKQFKVLLVKDNERSLQALLRKRGDIAFITHSYLMGQLHQHPALKNQLLISQQFDNYYRLGIILRPDHTLDRILLQQWLNQLEQQGFFENLRSSINPEMKQPPLVERPTSELPIPH